MSIVVFTGKGFNRAGAHLTRDEWTDLAHVRGHSVADKVGYGVDYLVAANPNSGSSKMRAARDYGTEVISYTQWQDILEGGRRSPAPTPAPQPVARAAPRFIDPAHVRDALDVRAAITGSGGRFAGEVAVPNFNRKPIYWGDVTEHVQWRGIAALHGHLPIFRRGDGLWPEGSDMDPCDDFDPDMAMEFKVHRVTTFIVANGRGHYLVNTEGYDYCRYVCKIEGIGDGLQRPAPEPVAVEPERKRRAIRL